MSMKKKLIFLMFYLIPFSLLGCKPNIPTVPPKDLAYLTITEKHNLASLKQIANLPLYTMEFNGNYDSQLRNNVYQALGLQHIRNRGCSTFAATSQSGEPFLARNHDFFETPILLLYTNPPNGYSSVSLVDLSLLGFNLRQKVTEVPLDIKTKLLYAPFLPCDGMNEYGLAIGTMYVPQAKSSNKSGKTIISLEALRLVLDHARSTFEALELLQRYQIEFPVLPSHFLICDSTGDAAVVEFIDGKTQVIRNREPWLAATNFTLFHSEKKLEKYHDQLNKEGKISGDINGRSYWRYLTLKDALQKSCGNITGEQAMNFLKTVSLEQLSWDVWMTTEWSVVYGLRNRQIHLVVSRNYDHILEFKLN